MRVSECVRECPPPHTQSILLHIPDDAEGVGSEVCVRVWGGGYLCERGGGYLDDAEGVGSEVCGERGGIER